MKNNMVIHFFKKFLFIFFLTFILISITKMFTVKTENHNEWINEEFKIVFNDKLDSVKLKELIDASTIISNNKEKIDVQKYILEEYQKYLSIFKFDINSKTKDIRIQHITSDYLDDLTLDEKNHIVLHFFANLNSILNGQEYYFSFKGNDFLLSSKDKLNKVKEFFKIKIGTNRQYIQELKYNNNNSLFNISKVKVSRTIENGENVNKFKTIEDKNFNSLSIFSNIEDKQEVPNYKYNELIREKKTDQNVNFLFLKEKNSDEKLFLKVFIDDEENLPIQWSSKIKWNYGFGWGYIWNVLIVFIGFFLSFFSTIFSSSEGIFFGNLGLGIILTTILIRTLSWPIYTKTSTFSLNMSLMQPEIDKIQEKYSLKKDPESIQKMQADIFKIYRKYNFNIFGVFVSFLQMPIFIAMLRTLNRFRVPGGIFKLYTSKPFLNFIYLDEFSTNNSIYTKIFLSLFVGITMFVLNYVSFQKSDFLKKSNKILTAEQELNKNKQEKTMKLISYFMIILMTLASFKDSSLSVYWIVGNIYTLFQTIVNRKIMKKKYYSLKKVF
ncbi:membrane protein insertase YidC [Texas Phoenix palm phytoplasma]|uniref:Membrane protein insertase YidC n=1 Tax=Texas Phoenix palm phytoplasma TaxID=176709 RepID=A0ABS5BJB3_9MOLU|nr:YidC/Oxa1 family membrane protein insertase [Texas Phoenix palm phytoplasma]MBP3059456.1 membrane protein insertase YidC [Texas Phoenix palm phytoplasma]